MARRRDPGWRDRAAWELLVESLAGSPPGASVLIMKDLLPEAASGLAREGTKVRRWNRRAVEGRNATPWPPSASFELAVLRLPRSRDELAMDLHAAAAVLRPGGRLHLYGANDEGIRSAAGPMGQLFSGVRTVGVGGRCRVLQGTRGEEAPGLRPRLADWRTVTDPGYPELGDAWVSYPGVFAHGRLDPGTRLLLDALPLPPPGGRVLDYGCGSGPVAAVADGRGRELEIEMSDVDAVALEAAVENVPAGAPRLREGLPARDDGTYDAVFSNPPFHRGKEEDPALVLELIGEAPRLLKREGVLAFVTQRRIRVREALEHAFREVRVLAQDATFRVWEGRRPS